MKWLLANRRIRGVAANRSGRVYLALGGLCVAATLLALALHLREPTAQGPGSGETRLDDRVVPNGANVASPDERATPLRVGPRHVGPQENRPGDLRFAPGD